MKETIDLLGKILTNILTALYEPFGFSLLLSFLVMFFYLYAYEPTAAGKGYDSANSCISYYNSADPVFSKEAKIMLDWRDRCWRYCYNLLDEYQAGKIERPSVEFVLESLPKIEWDND